MKTLFRLVLAAAGALLLLAGCAGPRYAEVSSRIPELEPGFGRIYFYQLAASSGADAAQPAIMVDGRKVGRSKPGRFFFVDRPAGTQTVIIATDRKNPDAVALKAELSAGQTLYVRVAVEGGRQVLRPEPSAELATQALADLKYWGAGWRDRERLRY